MEPRCQRPKRSFLVQRNSDPKICFPFTAAVKVAVNFTAVLPITVNQCQREGCGSNSSKFILSSHDYQQLLLPDLKGCCSCDCFFYHYEILYFELENQSLVDFVINRLFQ